MKPNCYECTHRRDIPGDAHSSCKHPAIKEADPFLSLVAMLHASRRVGPIEAMIGELKVIGNKIGINGGWFMHPLNFDPIWLESCNGFEAKQSTAVSSSVSQAS